MGEAAVYSEDLGLKNLQIKAYMRRLMASNHDERCLCCPYGYHVDLDFVDFAKDVAESHCELHKIRRYQRRLERAQTNLVHGRGDLAERIKEALTATNDVEFNSPNNENNLNNKKSAKQITKTKADNNDMIYISHNMDDSVSRSSDEAIIESPSSTQKNLNNSNSRNIFSNISLPEESYKKTLSNKSFVVSYEHLMSIREQMSASLKRVQELEQEAKKSQELRRQLDKVTEENQELQTQLTQQIRKNIVPKPKSELYLQLNSDASQWKTLSDLPSELLPNLERVFKVNSFSTQSTPFIPRLVKTKSTQTEIKGNLIVDTLSFLTNSTGEMSTQLQPKLQRRNFGVTVRPNHQHFTQQISFSSPKSFKPEESLISLNNLISIFENDSDKRVGALLHDTLCLAFKNNYQEAVNLLKQELQSSVKYKSLQSLECQTEIKITYNKESQVTACEYFHNKGVQANPILWNKCCNTRELSSKDSSSETEKVDLINSGVQTHLNNVNRDAQTECRTSLADFSCQYRYYTEVNHMSSSTDQNFIDDLISEYIETAMHIIQEELKAEYESKTHVKPLLDSLETNEDDVHSIDRGYDFKPAICDVRTQSSEDKIVTQKYVKSQGHHFVTHLENICLNYNAPIVNFDISENIPERLHNNLVRSRINCLDFTCEKSEDDQKPVNQGTNFTLQVNTEMRPATNEEINLENSDSTGSSPAEGCYYTTDRRIDYRNINQINEDEEEENVEGVTETEKKLTDNTEEVLMINSNTIKQDGDTSLATQFPDNISTACNLVTLWMNDSTTTCSKDLNESLTMIRSFWFGLTRGNDINLTFYLEKFKAFNSTLQERIINMIDPNGNTCLHYAVSEGRWSIVKQILETEQADVNKTNKAGYTVLMLAAVSDILDEPTLKLLISKSEVDKQSTNEAQQTALMLAASQGKTQLVQWLLEAGSSVNITDSDGSSALMCACDNGHSEVVRLFLSRPDTDTELEDKAGSNAMKIALDNSHKDIALLIFARNNLHKGSLRSKRRSGSSSHPTSPLSQRKFK